MYVRGLESIAFEYIAPMKTLLSNQVLVYWSETAREEREKRGGVHCMMFVGDQPSVWQCGDNIRISSSFRVSIATRLY